MRNKLLEYKNVAAQFHTIEGVTNTLNDIDLTIYEGMSLGIVGESGCGKSVTSRLAIRLLPEPSFRVTSGEVTYHRNGTPVNVVKTKRNGKEINSIRGKEISMIFQEPMSSLSPIHTIGSQMRELIMQHTDMNKEEAKEHAIHMLERARVPRAHDVYEDYTFQLSGGMRQRVMIAMAISCHPRLLFADEPTTALDVTVQAQILSLIKDVQAEQNMALVLITHDLAVVANMVEEIAVFYLGYIVEYGSTDQILNEPKHPYTKALIESIPTLHTEEALKPIKGSVPDPYAKITGCPFWMRCDKASEKCRAEVPPFVTQENGHKVRCFEA
ncbi:ABC transporter ATP-binding protein [Reinekea marinisedimentorum]|uniref:ABC-type dipeptide transporter n=1 Tax=Reinekea marinisedimentorum TaxID=230495 RepID=A0A4R3I616_9GAMM|nr:ABC transporter ATP-binding protein [Reinekea marinisedimentorum]TCS40449.1 peptide/nickel transport system ATP-binding protein [Reinekea marinisedimentorum]